MDIETTFAGKLKLLSLMLGVLTVALSSPSLCNQETIKYTLICYSNSYSKEQYFLAISCIALILSFFLVLAIVLKFNKGFKNWSMIDTVYHLVMAILLLVGWIVFVTSVADNHNVITEHAVAISKMKEYKTLMAIRSFALIFQLVNIMVYFGTAFLAFKNRN